MNALLLATPRSLSDMFKTDVFFREHIPQKSNFTHVGFANISLLRLNVLKSIVGI